jgi:hypothetical protein
MGHQAFRGGNERRLIGISGMKAKRELYRRRQNLVDSDTPLIHQNKGVKEHKNKYLQ